MNLRQLEKVQKFLSKKDFEDLVAFEDLLRKPSLANKQLFDARNELLKKAEKQEKLIQGAYQ